MQSEITAHAIEEILHSFPWMDPHTHIDAAHLSARGLDDILLYHMCISDLYAAGCPSGARIPEDRSEEEAARRIFSLPASDVSDLASAPVNVQLAETIEHRQATIRQAISERNAKLFEAEADKLDGWADDLKVGLEREIKELDRQIKEARRSATTALTLEEKLAGQKQIKALEAQRNQKRRSLFDAQDQVDKQREELIAVIEGKLNQTTALQPLFVLRWVLR